LSLDSELNLKNFQQLQPNQQIRFFKICCDFANRKEKASSFDIKFLNKTVYEIFLCRDYLKSNKTEKSNKSPLFFFHQETIKTANTFRKKQESKAQGDFAAQHQKIQRYIQEHPVLRNFYDSLPFLETDKQVEAFFELPHNDAFTFYKFCKELFKDKILQEIDSVCYLSNLLTRIAFFQRLFGPQMIHSESGFHPVFMNCHETIGKAQSSDYTRSLVFQPALKKYSFSQVTDLAEEAHKFNSSDLKCIINKIIDAKVHVYLQNPFTNKSSLTPSDLASRGFTLIAFHILEHTLLPGWIIKGDTSQVGCIENKSGRTGNNKYDHLNRAIMYSIMSQAVLEEELLIDFPQCYLIPFGDQNSDRPLEQKYILVEQKLDLPSEKDSIVQLYNMPYEVQEKYARDLCRLVLKTGYPDAHIGNMRLIKGKLYIFDSEPQGVLRDRSDKNPHFVNSVDACAAVGLQRIIDTLGQQLPVFRVVAERELEKLREKTATTAKTLSDFKKFIAAIKNQHKTDEEKKSAFDTLHPKIKEFLSFNVWVALGCPKGDPYFGEKKIFENFEYLLKIKNKEGISLVDQTYELFATKRSIKKTNKLLNKLKTVLQAPQPKKEALYSILGALNDECSSHYLLRPLLAKAFGKIPEHLDETQLSQFVKFLKTAAVSDSRFLLIDQLIYTLNCAEEELIIKICKEKLLFENECQKNYLPIYSTQMEQVMATRHEASLPLELVQQKFKVIIVAYECAKFGLKYGGLGEAVYGMAQGLLQSGHKVQILLPYFDLLPESTKQNLIYNGEMVEHTVAEKAKKDKVFETELEGIQLRILEDTDPSKEYTSHYLLKDRGNLYQDGVLATEEEWYGLKKRMMYFSSAAASYIQQHPEQDIAIFNDWHSAYAINLIFQRNTKEWSAGKTPATVFVIHNNNYGCQGIYSDLAP